MALQSTVNKELSFGVEGDIYDNSIKIVDSYILDSGATNTVAYAYTIKAANIETVEIGGTGVFAGILSNPKAYANTNSDLTVDGTVEDGVVGEFLKEGRIIVNLGGTASVGDSIYFVNATGAIAAGTAGAGQTQIVGAQVVLFDVGADGKAVIELNNQKA